MILLFVLLLYFKFYYIIIKMDSQKGNKQMKNAIFKADEQLQNGFKQIYPNNNNVEINVKSWHDARLWNTDWVFCVEWLWIRRARGTEGLTIYEKIKERRNLFLTIDSYYPNNYKVKMYLKKGAQTQVNKIHKIYITNGTDKPMLLSKANSKDYKKIAKKIDKIYFNIDECSLLIVIDKDFISKKEKKFLEEQLKSEEAKTAIESLLN